MIQSNNSQIFRMVLIILMLFNFSSAYSQNSTFDNNVSEWLGEEIFFLPIDTSSIKEPYKSWSLSPIKNINPSPSQVYGRKGIIVDLKRDDQFDPYFVTVDIVDSDTTLYAMSFDGHLPDVGFIKDFKKAMKLTGAILWNNRSMFYTFDSVLASEIPQAVKNLEPLFLWNIEWSNDAWKPIRLTFIEPGGRRVFINMNFSELNLSPESPPQFIENVFHKVNPRLTHPEWKEKLWLNIENEAITKKMSREAVLLSWGKPISFANHKEKDDLIEIWHYDRTPSVRIRFKNGILDRWETK